MRSTIRLWSRRSVALVGVLTLSLLGVSLLGGCGSSGSHPGQLRSQFDRLAPDGLPAVSAAVQKDLRPISGVREQVVGRGARAAFVLWSAGRRPPRAVVVFLHGWDELLTVPEVYGAWIDHLAQHGSTVIFPVYLAPRTTPRQAADNMFAGVAAGLRALGFHPSTLVVAGYTTGGALAFDYAAGAARAGLPRPDAVYAVYPARNPTSQLIPAIDPRRIAPSTRIAVVGGKGNPVINGNAQAMAMFQAPAQVPQGRRSYLAADPRANPDGSDPVTRRAFWAPLDKLIAIVRRDPGV